MLLFALLVVPAALFGMSLSPAVTPDQRRTFRLVAAGTGLLWLAALAWMVRSAVT